MEKIYKFESLEISVEGPLEGRMFDPKRGYDIYHSYYRACRIDNIQEPVNFVYGDTLEEVLGNVLLEEIK